MAMDKERIERVVEEVVRRVTAAGAGAPGAGPSAPTGGSLFTEVDAAVKAAAQAQRELAEGGIPLRQKVIHAIREAGFEAAAPLARMAAEETQMGRAEHKVLKNQTAARMTPGLEALKREVLQGDRGVTVVWGAAWGVIAAICPCTNPTATVINNSISMVAAGNGVVFAPHPAANRSTNEAVSILDAAIIACGGPAKLVCSIAKSSIETTTALMNHPEVPLVCATGAAGVVRAAMTSGKKAIAAGPGNPPVVVDETADLKRAARDIVEGAYFDNDLPCVGEKEIIVVEAVADALVRALQDAGAFLAPPSAETRLTRTAVDGHRVKREMVGKNASVILNAAGVSAPAETKIGIFETNVDHPLVLEEQLMPIVPVLRARNFDQAVAMAVKAERGYQHTALIHSRDAARISAFARAIDTCIFVANAPSYAWAGIEGQGYVTYTVGGPTGEGITCACHFVKTRHFVMGSGFGPEGISGPPGPAEAPGPWVVPGT